MANSINTPASPIPSSKAKKVCAIILALITWFAIIFQLYLTTGSVINFISYFTILCNLLVAVDLSISILAPSSKIGLFFSSLSVQTAITLYIFIVGLVYNLVLRGIVPLSGWLLVVDTLLHVVVPILYILYWLLFRPQGILHWRSGFYWALFPLVYLIYSLIRGSITNWYPYPFLNAHYLSYGRVFLNVVIMTAAFLVAGIILIAVTRMLHKKHTDN